MATVLLGSTGRGLARAEDLGAAWTVAGVLPRTVVTCLACDPLDADVVYAGTREGLLRSDDRGLRWREVGPPGRDVRARAPRAHEPGLVWVGLRPARRAAARDGGERWEELPPFPRWRSWFWFTPAERPLRRPYVLGLAESPARRGRLLAGIEAGALVLSEDGGRRFSGHRSGASRDCHTLVFHPGGAWAYQGGGTGPASSSDGGRTWRKRLEGLDRRYCWAVAGDPGQPERWYVAATPGPRQAHGSGPADARIFGAVDGGWEPLLDGLPDPLPSMPYGLACPGPGHVVAALADGGVFRSTDHGSTWALLPVTLGTAGRAFAVLADVPPAP